MFSGTLSLSGCVPSSFESSVFGVSSCGSSVFLSSVSVVSSVFSGSSGVFVTFAVSVAAAGLVSVFSVFYPQAARHKVNASIIVRLKILDIIFFIL